MDTATAVEEIRARLGELEPDFWTADEVLRALNAGCTRFALAERWEWLWTVTSATLTAGETRIALTEGVSPNRQMFLQGVLDGSTRLVTPRRVTTAEGVKLRARYTGVGNEALIYFVYSAEDAGSHELETITNTGSTSGTFTITFDGQTTATISRGASAADIRDALVALSNVGPADIRVYGGPLGTAAVYVEFRGQYAGVNVPAMTLGGTTTNMTVATPTSGGSASSLFSTTIEILPELSQDFDFDITYHRVPRTLTTGTDIVDIPEEYIDAVIAKATSRLWLKELRDSAKAQEQDYEYVKVLDDAKRDQRKLLPDEDFAWGKDEPQDGFQSESDFVYRRFSGHLG